jgi:hypothetical protein
MNNIKPHSTLDLSDRTPMELLQTFAAVIDELKRRGLVRTINNPVADYTEWLVTSKLKLTLLGNSKLGCDATSSDGTKYQIKGRRVSGLDKSIQLSALRNLPKRLFDFLVAVIYERDFSIRHALRIPYEVVLEKSTYQTHTNSYLFHVRPSLLTDTRVEDIGHMLAGEQLSPSGL